MDALVVLMAGLAIFGVVMVGMIEILVKHRNPVLVLMVGTLVLTGIVLAGLPIVNPQSEPSPVIAKMLLTAAVGSSISLIVSLYRKVRSHRKDSRGSL